MPTATDENENNSLGVTIGTVLGTCMVILVVIILLLVTYRRRKRKIDKNK